MITYFLGKSIEVSADLNYIAIKFLVYLSETSEFEQFFSKLENQAVGKSFISTIGTLSTKKELIERNDYRCVKEGIRYLINLSVMNIVSNDDITKVFTSMCKVCVKSNNANHVALAFLGLKLISQKAANHQVILAEPSLFEYMLRLDENIIQQNSKVLTVVCFNLLINPDIQKPLIDKNILSLIRKLVVYADEAAASQIQAVISSLIKYNHIQELMTENVEEVILQLLRIAGDKTTPAHSIVNGVYQTFYVDLSHADVPQGEDQGQREQRHHD